MQEYFEIDIYDENNKYFDTLPFNFESVEYANVWIKDNPIDKGDGFYKICRVTKEYI